ncbi:MAG: hypothetical protein R3288_00400 [Woeseiaceae bacterium]|nr:hypothetical protein [Woeseiaceae bacterium]
MAGNDRTILVVDRDPTLAENLKGLIEFMDTPSVETAVPADWRERLGERRLEALFVGPDLADDDVEQLLGDLAQFDPNVPVVVIGNSR